MKGSKVVGEEKGGGYGKHVTEGQYSLLDRGGKRRTDKDNTHWEMEGGGSERRDDRWMDGRKELAWSERAPRWGILGNPLNHGAPSQTKTVA